MKNGEEYTKNVTIGRHGMKRVYIAGPYSADNVLDVFENMRKGMLLATQVRQLGFAPFCPWMDFQYNLMNNRERFTLENCYEYSLAWLEVSDAMLMVPGWQSSVGAIEEHKFAAERNIPIFYRLIELDYMMGRDYATVN